MANFDETDLLRIKVKLYFNTFRGKLFHVNVNYLSVAFTFSRFADLFFFVFVFS